MYVLLYTFKLTVKYFFYLARLQCAVRILSYHRTAGYRRTQKNYGKNRIGIRSSHTYIHIAAVCRQGGRHAYAKKFEIS